MISQEAQEIMKKFLLKRKWVGRTLGGVIEDYIRCENGLCPNLGLSAEDMKHIVSAADSRFAPDRQLLIKLLNVSL